ncbi:MAG TPA: hypothetical protein DEH78_07435 [Solibacterales bacterium]|nr:hypothetical protein [Bryobacterales bacterium]
MPRASTAILRAILCALAAGFLARLLVQWAPGFGAAEQVLDPGYSDQSRRELMAKGDGGGPVLSYYRQLSGLWRGDWGDSESLQQPVARLVRERLPATARVAGTGWLAGWAVGLPAALLVTRFRALRTGAAVLSGASLSLPAALFALALLHGGAGAEWAVALVVAPRVFEYAARLLEPAAREAHVTAARARGLSGLRILALYVLPPAGRPLAALAAVTVCVALGAAVPVEVVSDTPGLGQLAWQAAQNRDASLLVGVTWVVALLTLSANGASEVLTGREVAA